MLESTAGAMVWQQNKHSFQTWNRQLVTLGRSYRCWLPGTWDMDTE